MNERSLLDGTTAPYKGANEEVILLAALKWFGELGFHGASMRVIADEAGTSLSNLYNYYRSKSDILVAVLLRANAELHARVSAAASEHRDSPTAERLSAAVKAYVAYTIDHSTESVVALSELRYLQERDRERVVVGRDATQDLFERIVSDGVDAGDFATPYPTGAARSIVSMLSSIAVWYRPDGKMPPIEVADQHSRYALALLEAR